MIITGNIISLIASIFMVASCIVKQRRQVFHLQFIQCVLLAVSSWFFTSYSGIVANLVSALRNLAVAQNRFTKKTAMIFLAASVILGFMFNNRGWIGLLPMAANVQFALCCYLVTGLKQTKYSIWLNVLLWIIYSFLVLDFATAVSDCAVLFVNTVTILQLHVKERRCRQDLSRKEIS